MHKKIACILIPVHNRKEITRSCLLHLNELGHLYLYHVIVIDDGSTDGTAEMIAKEFPEIILLQGDGTLWWTGAIVEGMKHATSLAIENFIWLNDDTLPSPNSIPLLIEACQQYPNHIFSAQCYADFDLKYPTYGGHTKSLLHSQLIQTSKEEILDCDCFSGNLVCFPRAIIDDLGYPNAVKMPHCFADAAYTWKAKKNGYQLKVLGTATAVCALNPREEGWVESSIPMLERWRTMLTLKSNIYPPAFWHFCLDFYGVVAPIVFIKPYLNMVFFTILKLIFPASILLSIKNTKKILVAYQNRYFNFIFKK